MSDALIKFFAVPFAIAITISGCSDGKQEQAPAGTLATKPLVAKDIKIKNWGPKSTESGKAFNQQPNGDSALWFEQNGIHDSKAVDVYLGDVKLRDLIISPNAKGTVSVPIELIKKPGKYPVYVSVPPTGEKVDLGMFEVASENSAPQSSK